MKSMKGGPRKAYGCWGGNPEGHPYNPTRCAESVSTNERGAIAHQCGKKRGHGADGLWCKIHDPAYVQAKAKACQEKYDAHLNAKQRDFDLVAKRKDVANLAKELIKVRSFGAAFDALEKAVEQLNDLEKES